MVRRRFLTCFFYSLNVPLSYIRILWLGHIKLGGLNVSSKAKPASTERFTWYTCVYTANRKKNYLILRMIVKITYTDYNSCGMLADALRNWIWLISLKHGNTSANYSSIVYLFLFFAVLNIYCSGILCRHTVLSLLST